MRATGGEKEKERERVRERGRGSDSSLIEVWLEESKESPAFPSTSPVLSFIWFLISFLFWCCNVGGISQKKKVICVSFRGSIDRVVRFAGFCLNFM